MPHAWSSAAITAPASDSPSPNLKGPNAGVTSGSRSATAPWPTPARTPSRTGRCCRPGAAARAGARPRVRREDRPTPCNLYVSMLLRLGLEMDKFGGSTGTLTGLEALAKSGCLHRTPDGVAPRPRGHRVTVPRDGFKWHFHVPVDLDRRAIPAREVCSIGNPFHQRVGRVLADPRPPSPAATRSMAGGAECPQVHGDACHSIHSGIGPVFARLNKTRPPAEIIAPGTVLLLR